ncbi:hypothetical protein CAI21_15535 [Alkalilimnicola ehrlichii]|uniref:HMA domain-containing protein n=1 Tax=Alkalilimnicola ehrlichii TaxID=351052 RepID=A0A3E0WQ51_9GAMM|nr:heavy metal-associated domain-containing protein [Alkalilimnicola ehrlichii]RFA26977.1 hypothetical protein CAI21_15535 [Alkalilimnicola ehrlichii]RFA34095.1 hypothetical protein CAL65_15670 [Alkalilimnicola ehrlichii]
MPTEGSKRTQHLEVQGMSCPACKDNVEKALRAVGGVEDVQVWLDEETASVVGEVEPDELIKALSRTNYQARPLR